MVGSVLKLIHSTKVVRSCSFSTTNVLNGGHIRMHNWWGPEKIQGREVVGWGVKGDEVCFCAYYIQFLLKSFFFAFSCDYFRYPKNE